MPMTSAQYVVVVAAEQPVLSLQELCSPLRTVLIGTSDRAFTHTISLGSWGPTQLCLQKR